MLVSERHFILTTSDHVEIESCYVVHWRFRWKNRKFSLRGSWNIRNPDLATRRFAWNFVLRLLGFNTFYSTPASCTGFNNVNNKDNGFAHKFGRLTKGQEVADLSLRQIARLCSYRADLLLVELQKRMQGFVFSSASKSPIFYMLTRVFMQDSASMPTFAWVASIVRIFKFESIHWMLTVNTMATAHQNS